MFQSSRNVLLIAGLLFSCAQLQCSNHVKNESELKHTNFANGTETKQEANEKEIYNDILALNSNGETEEILEKPATKDAADNIENQLEKNAELETISAVDKNESAVLDKHLKEEQKVHVIAEVSAPSYNKLIPIKGWDRYSGDSARSIKQWGRWWQYLRMKEPVVMSWVDGFILRIYPGNEVFRSLFVRGIYDPNIVVVINSLLSKGSVFIDVGANMGYFSLLASSVVGKFGHIIAIEPSSRDYARLVDNVKINNLTNIISTYHIAISDVSGSAKLAVACEERSALNTLGSEFSFKGVDKVETENVKVVSIDELVSDINLTRVDVLKLDIEGSELKALQGARNVIEKFRPAIMLGVNVNSLKACGTDHKEIQQILREIRYRAYKIVESPTFALELIPDLEKERAKVVFCLHESVIPPVLPQPENKSIADCIEDFFLR